MCGIAGLFSLDDRHPDPALVERMLRRLVHRGPDDEGCDELGPVVLGMRRLSILDPTPRGHQPMTSPDGRYTIVFNGEIYNFLELADELRPLGHAFATSSDTEVLLAAYATWGPDCAKRLNGIWAFAIWDARERTLFLSRDRFGVKPLYLAEESGNLAFASEIKALQTLPWVSGDPDVGVVRTYLLDGSLGRGSRTFFREIQCFPAAHSLLISPGGRHLDCYWPAPELTTDPSFGRQAGDEERIEEFRSLLIDSVALQLRSDVAIGSCLSGGLDSSSIVSIAAALRSKSLLAPGRGHKEREATPQLAFFAQFREAGIDERPYVDAVVAATGVALRTTTPDTDLFLESLPGILRAQDEPFGSTSIVAQYHVMRIAHEAGVKVLLDGQGADELLGGYVRYPAMRLAGALRSPRTAWQAGRTMMADHGPFRATLGYALIGTRRMPSRLNRRRMPSRWIGRAAGSSGQAIVEPVSQRGTLLTKKLWFDVASDNLPDLLRYEDRNSMAFGIEARVPFLDHRLAEASLLLPDRLKIGGREERKIVLKTAMQGIVPDDVLRRRDKVAFQPPERRWLLEAEPVWRRLASRSRAEAADLLAPWALSDAIEAFRAGRVGSSLLWRALNLEMWLRGAAGEEPLA
ncbi:MAG: asparagine synthase (glutamine-hydrolyzing) [Candidatus Limnocylindrales bacterium]|jgi:asparagine synthase (glutamine-hydrolysing)